MFNIFSRKQTPVWSIVVSGKEGSPAWTQFNRKEAGRVFANIDTVYSCIDVIASGFSQIGFKAVEKSKDGTKKESFDHPVLSLLNKPSAQMSAAEYLYAYAAWKLIAGESYQYLNTPNPEDYRQKPIELNILRSDRMQIVPSETGIMRYEYEVNGLKMPFPVDQVSGQSNIIHSKFYNPTDDFYGLSPMQAAAKGIDIYESMLKWNRSLLENSCRPSGLFTYTGEGQPDADQIQQIRKAIAEQTGPENAGKPMFGGKLDFKQMSIAPKDMEFLAAKENNEVSIARTFKVPPVLINIGSGTTYSNMAEARLALWDEAIIPLAKCFAYEVNTHIMPRFGAGNTRIEIDTSEVTALEPRREMQWDRAKTADFLTINERRNIIGYEDVDDGDTVLVPASSVPLSFAASDFSMTDSEGVKKKPW